MTSFLDLWGSGNARMKNLIPSTRIACGVFVFASCLIAPACNALGISIISGIVVCWVLLCGIPWKSIVNLSLYSLLLFLPLFLLAPWMDTAAVPFEIGIRGTAGILVCASTITILDLAEFDIGLRNLPIPRIMTMLLSQIVHQTAMLTNESRRISSAVRVRGMPAGCIAKLRFTSALPTIWILRIMNRAERISAAMELRGFEITTRTSCESGSFLDAFAMVAVILLLGATITIRWMNVS